MSKITVTDSSVAASLAWAYISMSGDQSSNLGANDHIEFDTITEDGSGTISLATGAGQSDGLITLAADRTYELSCRGIKFTGSASTARVIMQWRDNTQSNTVGTRCENNAIQFATDDSMNDECYHVFTPAESTEVEVRFITVTGLTHMDDEIFCIIKELP